MRVTITMIDGDTVSSDIDAANMQEAVDIIFGGDFFMEEGRHNTVIIPTDKIVRVWCDNK